MNRQQKKLPTKSVITSQAVQEYVETIGAEDLKDYKILTVHVHAPGMIHTKNKLIKSIGDFQGMKMRGPTRVITTMLKSMGATPVGMPVPKVAPSLSTLGSEDFVPKYLSSKES